MTLPSDITETINEAFSTPAGRQYVTEKLCSLWTIRLMVRLPANLYHQQNKYSQ